MLRIQCVVAIIGSVTINSTHPSHLISAGRLSVCLYPNTQLNTPRFHPDSKEKQTRPSFLPSLHPFRKAKQSKNPIPIPSPIPPPFILPSSPPTPTSSTTFPHRRRPNGPRLLLLRPPRRIAKRIPKVPPFRLHRRPSRPPGPTGATGARILDEAVEAVRGALGAGLDGLCGLGGGEAGRGGEVGFCYLHACRSPPLVSDRSLDGGMIQFGYLG